MAAMATMTLHRTGRVQRYDAAAIPCVCHVVPPDLLAHVVVSSARESPGLRPERREKARRAALSTLQIDASLRSVRVGRLERARLRRAARLELGRPLLERLAALAAPQKDRSVYTAAQQTRLPGTLVRSEGEPATADVAVNEAYDWLGATWDFYFDIFQRDSIDDRGKKLIGTVHFSQDYDNAFFDGRQMVFGDGDGQVFTRFTVAVDVVGHELTHGVIQDEAALIYWGQPGALNESLADVFGSMVKQYHLNQTAAAADWLIGEGLFIPGAVKGVALRSMEAPGTAYGYPDPDPVLGKDTQPANMSGFVRTLQDNGGVHTNSGIPNHAFYLAATNIGGYAWERAGLIWYRALQSPLLRPTASFRTFARLTVRTARQLFGGSSVEASAVEDAWEEVGVLVKSSVRVG